MHSRCRVHRQVDNEDRRRRFGLRFVGQDEFLCMESGDYER